MSEKAESSASAGMSKEQIDAAERARLQRDYRELSPGERVRQVVELSRHFSQQTPNSRDR